MDNDAKNYIYSDAANQESVIDGQMTFDQAIDQKQEWTSLKDPELKIKPENIKKYTDKEHDLVAYVITDDKTGTATIVYQNSGSANSTEELLDASNDLTEKIIADNPKIDSFTTTGYERGGSYAQNSLTIDKVSGATGFSSPDISYTMTPQELQIANSKESTFYGDANDPVFLNGRLTDDSVTVGLTNFFKDVKQNVNDAHNLVMDRIEKGIIAVAAATKGILASANQTSEVSNQAGPINLGDQKSIETILADASARNNGEDSDTRDGISDGGVSGDSSMSNQGDTSQLRGGALGGGVAAGSTGGPTITVEDGLPQASEDLNNVTVDALENIKYINDDIEPGITGEHDEGTANVASDWRVRPEFSLAEVREIAASLTLDPPGRLDEHKIAVTAEKIEQKKNRVEEIAQLLLDSKDNFDYQDQTQDFG